MVGTHRQIGAADLVAYKRRQDGGRRNEALAELPRQVQDLGLGY